MSECSYIALCSAASRVGKGEQSLSETLRSSRAFGSSADAVEDDGSVYGSRIFSPGALRKSGGGFGSPLRRSAASSIWEETGSLRGSKAEFANRRDSAIRTSRRLGDDASRPARGRRWSFLVGRLLAVTAWQKTRLLLQLLQRVLHHSEVRVDHLPFVIIFIITFLHSKMHEYTIY